jgi:hypothetical protein
MTQGERKGASQHSILIFPIHAERLEYSKYAVPNATGKEDIIFDL